MDLHRYTVYHDETFHLYMDGLEKAKIIPPNWREWPFREVRPYAKAWNWGRMYGITTD